MAALYLIMNRVFKNIPLLTVSGVVISGISLYFDWGSETFSWFQRSGSLVVLIGALLSYRSVFRLGVRGVGGVPSSVGRIGKVKGSYIDENGFQKVKVEISPEDAEYDRQAEMDKIAGFIGATFIILGTIIWGYGDLAGKI